MLKRSIRAPVGFPVGFGSVATVSVAFILPSILSLPSVASPYVLGRSNLAVCRFPSNSLGIYAPDSAM
jgi:hypothetical protein